MNRLDHTVDLLRTLVQFDTTSARSNLALIDFVIDYLRQFGVQATLTHDATRQKANLYATLGRPDKPGICLSGHSDVVPVTGQNWHYEPFQLTEHQGKLYGRGTADMKGYLACMLASVPMFLEQGHNVPFHLAISYDEEVGCVGVRELLAALAQQAVQPLACIIGEPTRMRLAVAHKGKRAWRCQVHGCAGHSALTHLGVNAVEYAAELVAYLRRLNRQLQADGPYNPRFEPPYTTVHTGKIQGGIALNVIPHQCELDFEIRNIPQDDPQALFARVQSYAETELLPQMRAVAPETGFTWQELAQYPALQETTDNAWLRQLAQSLLGSTEEDTLSFGTEGGLFQEIGIPTIVCGPGSMDQGHKPDEYVEIAQLASCLDFLQSLAHTAAHTSLPTTAA